MEKESKKSESKLDSITRQDVLVMLVTAFNIFLFFALFPSVKMFLFTLTYDQRLVLYIVAGIYSLNLLFTFLNIYSGGSFLFRKKVLLDRGILKETDAETYESAIFARSIFALIIVMISEILVGIFGMY